MLMETKIFSFGGSIVVPEQIDTYFLKEFKDFFEDWINSKKDRRAILVIGGGATARKYQKALQAINPELDHDYLDWMGIEATRLNARLMKTVFADYCPGDIIINPEQPGEFQGKIMIAAGWKPGFSTDFDAVLLAKHFKADTVLNLSNIEQVYSTDPKIDPKARALDQISWEDFKKIVGTEWIPGKNLPFDPVATAKAARLKLRVIVAAGRDLDNLQNILKGLSFKGTTIGPY